MIHIQTVQIDECVDALFGHILQRCFDVKYAVLKDGQIIHAVGDEFMESQYNKLV